MSLNTLITAFLIYVMSVAAILPAGFMPGQGEDGQTTLIICTGAFTAEIPVEGDTPNPSAHPDTPCAFCSLVTLDRVDSPTMTALNHTTSQPSVYTAPPKRSDPKHAYTGRAPPLPV